jgi:ferredoxin
MYAADQMYTAFRPGRSLIPLVHYWLGIRPAIRRKDCTRCGDCAVVCPADAIDIPSRRIIAGACMRLRCLRCIKACPVNAIEVKGWRRPS